MHGRTRPVSRFAAKGGRVISVWLLMHWVLSPRSKVQVKHLEQALTDLAGPNWKVVASCPSGFRSLTRGFLDRTTSRSHP